MSAKDTVSPDSVNQDVVESQLSAMFDGELPAAECELLSRRIDRDERLRARWSRYAMIGAAMRCEPVATARSDFAARVSRAVDRAAARGASTARSAHRRHLLWQGALAATLVGAVAGLSILMLRSVALRPAGADLPAVASSVPVTASVPAGDSSAPSAAARLASAAPGAQPRSAQDPVSALPDREPFSYVTPRNDAGGQTPLRTELVNYIVAHSEYSTPLMRSDLLSELISGEEGSDNASPVTGAAGTTGAAGAPADAAAGDPDATSAPPASGH